MQRPGANEGGREEEEKRSGISASLTGRLHNREMVWEGSFDTHADAAVTVPPGKVPAPCAGMRIELQRG